MSGITGMSTTFVLPNFHGELMNVTPTDTPLLSAAGGLSGGQQSDSTSFEWQFEDLRAPSLRPRLEGADAPTSEARVRSNVQNVAQIFHESITTSYTKQAAIGQYQTNSSAPYNSPSGGANPIADEHGHQTTNALKTIATDVNYAFWHSKKVVPTDNTTARQTAGLLSVISTNRIAAGEVTAASAATDTITVTHSLANGDKIVFTDIGASTAIRPDRFYYVVNVSGTASFKVANTAGGSAITIGTATVAFIKASVTITPDVLGSFMQGVFDNGGISESGTATLFVSSRQKRALTTAYAAAYRQVDPFNISRNVGGVNMQTIETDFGTLNLVVDRAVPTDAIVLTSLEQISPVFLNIPGKGVLFEEDLARTGSSIKSQIYGEIGLRYGSERQHGVLRGLAI